MQVFQLPDSLICSAVMSDLEMTPLAAATRSLAQVSRW
jgi:hypothetical protein